MVKANLGADSFACVNAGNGVEINIMSFVVFEKDSHMIFVKGTIPAIALV